MAVTTEPRILTTLEVCNLAGISLRQINYWCQAGYLNPEPDPEPGTGHHRRWPAMEAAKAVALAGMLRRGITHAKAVELISEGRTAHLVSRELRDTIVDDLPPSSRGAE